MPLEQYKQKSGIKGFVVSRVLSDNYMDNRLERGKLVREINLKPLQCYKREAKTMGFFNFVLYGMLIEKDRPILRNES